MEGTIENLSPEQEQIKNELKRYIIEEKGVKDQWWNDWYLLRFCRAWKFKIAEIKKMVDKYLEW